jgi:hypothetical protein
MAKVSLVLPVIKEKRTTAEPKVDTALQALETWANGNVGLENMENKGVLEEKLSTALQTKVNEKTAGGTMKKSIIATEEERTSAVFGTLTTPDEVEVEMVANGLIAVWFQATWQESVAKTANAALYMNANALVITKTTSAGASAPSSAAAMAQIGYAGKYVPLWSYSGGLTTPTVQPNTGYTADETTGQIVGGASGTERGVGGPCWIFASGPEKYKISVRFASSSGTVKVKKRKLWAIAYA